MTLAVFSTGLFLFFMSLDFRDRLVVIGTKQDEIVEGIVLRLRILNCMVDVEWTATNPIPAEAADSIGGLKNGIYEFIRDRCPVDLLLDDSDVGLTVIRLERLIRQGAERTDGMPMCFDSCDQIRIESKAEERSVSSDIHAKAESIFRTQNIVSQTGVRSIS